MIPSLIQKKTCRSSWPTLMPIFLLFAFVVWSSHASPLPRVHLRFRVWPLCSPLSVVIYSFCSLSIRSKFRTKSWSIFFSSSLFGLSDRSFDPSVDDEELASLLRTLEMGTVDASFCLGYYDYFHFVWASDPFVARFEFGPRT